MRTDVLPGGGRCVAPDREARVLAAAQADPHGRIGRGAGGQREPRDAAGLDRHVAHRGAEGAAALGDLDPHLTQLEAYVLLGLFEMMYQFDSLDLA